MTLTLTVGRLLAELADLDAGLDEMHDAIVKSFKKLTPEPAQEWGGPQ